MPTYTAKTGHFKKGSLPSTARFEQQGLLGDVESKDAEAEVVLPTPPFCEFKEMMRAKLLEGIKDLSF